MIKAVAQDKHVTVDRSVTHIKHNGNIIHKSGNKGIRSTTCTNDGYHAGMRAKRVIVEESKKDHQNVIQRL